MGVSNIFTIKDDLEFEKELMHVLSIHVIRGHFEKIKTLLFDNENRWGYLRLIESGLNKQRGHATD
jgi:hypothetical protein